jgi:polysaccharide biosynthesis protein PslJ
VLLTLALPLAVHQSVHAPWPRRATARRIFWVVAAVLMMVGSISTVSRTSMVVMGVMTAAALVLRPALLGPLLVIGSPAALAASLVAPGAVLNMVNSFLNPEELVESQYSNPGWTGSGRLADIGPSLEAAGHTLWFGTGVGSRVVTGPDANALILDNQLLGILLMHGVFGLAAALAIFLYPAWRMIRFAGRKGIAARHTDLAVAVACVCLAYPVALFFFDGFSFEQTLLFVLILMAAASFLITHVGPTAAGRPAIPAGTGQTAGPASAPLVKVAS